MTQDVSPCSPSGNSVGALIAGEGALPLLVAEYASRSGLQLTVYCLGDRSAYVGLCGVEAVPLPSCEGNDSDTRGGLDLRATIQDMLRRRVGAVTLAGTVPKRMMYEARLDPSLRALLAGGNNDDHSLLGRIVGAFESAGLRVLPYTSYLADSLAPEGHVAGRDPSDAEAADIEYGRSVLSVTLPLSFGQSVVVAGGAVVAVEAMEGTDAMIRRAGELLGSRSGKAGVDVPVPATGGGVVVKMMRCDQDERYDVPVVGLSTLETMRDAGVSCLAVEAGRTLLLHPETFRERAAMWRIAVVGISGGSTPLSGGPRS
mgnify:CR=1 FL=1